MGLDITAASKVDFANRIDDEPEDYDNYLIAYVHSGFPGRADGVPGTGFYRINGESVDFRAGSYSGYNNWRSQLARLVGANDVTVWRTRDDASTRALPFYELIDFADNEGVIGPVVSAKLAKHFADWQERAEQFAAELGDESGRWFLEKYADWRKAFELAANGGAVSFH